MPTNSTEEKLNKIAEKLDEVTSILQAIFILEARKANMSFAGIRKVLGSVAQNRIAEISKNMNLGA